ncbi:MAG: Alpha/beta hydrolase [Bacteroidetes bacterium]|jgi:pimeloyl-ACP methyl ester carboxylesterase|nr:Alpha/beta hydrolase [Bacteroidota bacterium]
MKTNVYTKGAIEKGAILFIHGNSLNGTSFRRVFDLIDDIPLIAVDLPGHGRSQKAVNPEATYSIPGYVEAIKQLVEEFKLTDFILTGHSLGGHIALEAIDELKGVKGVFLFGTPPLGIPPDMDTAFLPNPALGLLFQKDLSEDEMDPLCDALLDPVAASSLKENIKEQLRCSDGNARTYLLHSVGAGKQKNEPEIVKSLQIPLAIAHGELDSVINLQYLEALDKPTLWENKIHLIKNSGHSPQMEQPEAFAALLKKFHQHVSA